MAKINLQKVSILQMDGSYQETDIRKDVCQPLWIDKEKEMVMFQQRLWQGECELTADEDDGTKFYVGYLYIINQ